MKANTKNIMKSKFESDNMNIGWRASCGCKILFGMPVGKHLNSENSRRLTDVCSKISGAKRLADSLTKK